MYFPKRRHPAPEGHVDKFDAADLLGLHPETFLARIRIGKIKITPQVVTGKGCPVQHFYRVEDLNRIKLTMEAEEARKARKLREAQEFARKSRNQ